MISIKQHRRLTVDGKPLVELPRAVHAGLKTVGTLDLDLPERLGGLRLPKGEEECCCLSVPLLDSQFEANYSAPAPQR